MARKAKLTIRAKRYRDTSLRALLYRARQSLIIVAWLCVAFSMPASASYIPFNTNNKMNIGLGTSTPQTTLVVTSGNVGIGTWTAAGGNLIVNGGGNVGIGSAWPGQALDVNGTVRASFFLGNGSGLTNLPPSGWTLGTGNVGISTTNSVGIGTGAPSGALEIEGGNVGIGTWTTSSGQLIVSTRVGNVGIGTITPGQALDVQGTVRDTGEIVNGNVGIGTSTPQTKLAIVGGNVGIGTWNAAGGNLIVNGGGNVGIGTAWPGTALDVNGTIRTTTTGGITFGTDNKAIIEPSAVTAADIRILTNALEVMRITSGGNVGIGTTTPQAGFVVTNGNVGIGTWTAAGGNLIVNGGGNVGIASAWPGYTLDVNGGARFGGNGASTFNTNIGIGSLAPGAALDVQGGIRSSQVSGQTAGTLLCVRTDGTIGYCSGSVTAVSCTCN